MSKVKIIFFALRFALCFALCFALTGAWGETPETISRAVTAVNHINGAMLDPTSFVLEQALTTLPDKHGVYLCFAFRSHNTMGGFSDGRAWLSPDNRLRLFQADRDGHFVGYDEGWVDPCRSKRIAEDITAAVIAARTAPVPLTRADRTKWLADFNADAQKNGVPLYGEIIADTLTIHSERASDIRWHAMLLNESFMAQLRQMGIATLVYTNDKDFKEEEQSEQHY